MTRPTRQPAALGLWDGHDAGVALVAGGELCFALSEERPSRRKRFSGFPRLALRAALGFADARGLQVTDVGLAGRHGRAPLRLLEPIYRRGDPARDPLSLPSAAVRTWENTLPSLPLLRGAESALAAAAARLRAGLPAAGGPVRWHLVDHHDAHAFSALLCDDGEGPAAVITWDAYGEGRSATVRSSRNPTEVLGSLPPSAGLASLYGAVTVLQGFGEGDEGKVMGLAATGRPEPARSRFLALFRDGDGAPILRRPLARGALLRLMDGLSRPDAAAGLQAAVEELALRWIDRARAAVPGARRLLLAGGLFGNVLLNRALASLPGLDACRVFPHMGDGGLAAGAAHAAWHARHAIAARPLAHVLLGPEPDPATFVSHAAAAGLRARPVADPAAEAARHLRAGRVVCRYDGRDEFGPRALGNRSILFPASDPALPARVNAALRRDGFMPFAPAVHPAEAAAAFPASPPAADLRFMTCCADASDAFRRDFPGGVHVDGTARPQVADPLSAPGLHAVLSAGRAAGVRAVVNTSFNLHGEPIVHTPADAVRTFVASGLDVLVLGNLVAEARHAVD